MVAVAALPNLVRCHACGFVVAEYTPRGVVIKRIRWVLWSGALIRLRCGNSRRFGSGAGDRGVCGAETVIVNRENRREGEE